MHIRTLLALPLLVLLGGGHARAFDFGDLEKALKPNQDIQNAINLTKTAIKSEAEFNEEQKYYIGRSVGAHLLMDRTLMTQAEAEHYVSYVGQVLALACDKPDTFKGYHFILLDDARVNAYTVPGGFIFVTSALVQKAASEDELAGVLAHEIAHVVLEHPTESIKQSYRDALKKDLFGVAADKIGEKQKDDLAKRLVAGLNDLSGMLIDNAARGYSRDKEDEADVLAVQILANAGYDPRALATVLAKLDPIGAGDSGTHGDPRKRAAHVSGVIEQTPGAQGIPVSARRTLRFTHALKPR